MAGKTVAARGRSVLPTGAAGIADLFVQGFLVVIPGAMDHFAILIPIRIGIGGGPICFQAIFHFVIPLIILVAVMGTRAITKAQGGFHFFVIRFAARWNRFLAGGLFDGVADVLVGVGLFAAEIVLRLVPIALERFAPWRGPRLSRLPWSTSSGFCIDS